MSVLIGTLAIVGALFMLTSAVAMLRHADALTRINVLSPATGMGLPLIVVAAWLDKLVYRGFEWMPFIQTIITIAALLVVSSVASNALARAAYLSGAPVDPRTDPQDLAREPEA
ncbi:MAG: cation:proton antiporter [Actinomycetota bacterium]